MTTPTRVTELDPTEVQIGTSNGPGLWVAPAGTAAPPAGPLATPREWPAPWSVLGYLSDDGPTISMDIDQEDIIPWQSPVPIRSIITGRTVNLEFVMWQLNARTLAMYFDTPVPEMSGDSLHMEVRSDEPQQLYAVGIDTADAERTLRIVFPRASMSDAGDMEIQRGAAVPLEVTLSALDFAGILADVYLGPGTETDTRAQSAVRQQAQREQRTPAP